MSRASRSYACWTAKEDAALRAGQPVAGRTRFAIDARREKLKQFDAALGALGNLGAVQSALPVTDEGMALRALADACAALLDQFEPLPRTRAMIEGRLGQPLKMACRVLDKR